MSDTVTAETLAAVVLNERYRDAVVAWFEAAHTDSLEFTYEYDLDHPNGCKCEPCIDMESRNNTRRTKRLALLKAAIDARKAVSA